MTEPRTHIRSPYMEFAKLHSHARLNLATSGVEGYPLFELPARIEDLEINGPSYYGYEPLQQRLGRHCAVDPACVVHSVGTSLANHLALAACAEPGDDVLMEHPVYELIATAARFLGLNVRYFKREFDNGFRIDPQEVERHMTPRTRLIVITNLHNPSGVLTPDDTLRQLVEIARSNHARLLVDEVYLDMAFEHAPPTSFHLSPRDIVVTNSLTKTYGLSGIRCGWILADPDLARRIWRISDLFCGIPAHPAERLSVIALDNLERIRERAETLLTANRSLLNEFLSSRHDLSVVRNDYGTVTLPKLLKGEVDRFHDVLREKYETSIVPGRFFDMPRHFRIGVGGQTEMVKEGLRRLGAALDEFH